MNGPHCNCINIPTVNIIMNFYDTLKNIASMGKILLLCLCMKQVQLFNIFFRYDLFLYDGFFSITRDVPGGWTHIVVNYIGLGSSEGIYLYLNGNKRGEDTTIMSATLQAGNGRVVVGKT